MDFLVAAEEGVEPALQPVAVTVTPRRKLPAGDVAPLEDERGPSRVGEVFGGGKPSRSGPDDDDIRLFDRDQMMNPVGDGIVALS